MSNPYLDLAVTGVRGQNPYQPGKPISELEREYGKWLYELKIIEPSGRLLELYVDAETGEILKVEED